MSKRDLFQQDEYPMEDLTQQPFFDPEAFSDIFRPDQIPEFEFEDDPDSIYIPPAEGMKLPVFDAVEPSLVKTPDNTSGLEAQIGVLDPVPFSQASPNNESDNPGDSDYPQEGWVDYEPTMSNDEEYDDDPYDEDEEYDDDDEIIEKKPRKKHHVLHVIANVMLGFVTAISLLYLVAIYSNNSVITSLRNMYIQTAMSSLSHKWLATAIIPSDMIDDLMRLKYESENSMLGVESNWGSLNISALPTFENDTTEHAGYTAEDVAATYNDDENLVVFSDTGSDTPEYESPDEETFFKIFYEIDYESMHDYIDENPSVLNNGWAYIDINEAGLSDEGTSIKTVYGDQVLAINAQAGVVLIRINFSLSRGVMAICKDTSQLHLRPASTIGVIGQTVGRICEAYDGLLAVTGNAFVDQDGSGNGGDISGVGVCNGTRYGDPIWGYKRVEIRDDNKMYIVDSSTPISSSVREACEFTPALIIDGDVVVDENCGWTSPNPRTAIGQTAYLETMMVVMEGRFVNCPGCSVVTIAELMQKYGCVQAMNLDGGTSAIMYYDGEYITRCCNTSLPGGRPMPTAWVYG